MIKKKIARLKDGQEIEIGDLIWHEADDEPVQYKILEIDYQQKLIFVSWDDQKVHKTGSIFLGEIKNYQMFQRANNSIIF